MADNTVSLCYSLPQSENNRCADQHQTVKLTCSQRLLHGHQAAARQSTRSGVGGEVMWVVVVG
jgi:hypothetical protein